MLSTGLHLPCGDVDVEADGAEMFIDNTVFKTAMMQRQRVPTSCYPTLNAACLKGEFTQITK